ncbi:MAG TPA: hypothetical protein VH593_20095, partial [Ktedonobacteraceae bacterium]
RSPFYGQESNPEELVAQWKHYLEEHDHSPGTVKKYTQAVTHFYLWYEREERMPLRLSHLTPDIFYFTSLARM